jgi:DNA-binding NarL/FixJ family response regulator
VIVKSDRVYGAMLCDVVRSRFPVAEVSLLPDAAAARSAHDAAPADLLVCALGGAPDGNVLDLVLHATREPRSRLRILVISSETDVRAFSTIHQLHTVSIFDATVEAPENLAAIVELVAGGSRYFSPSVLGQLQQRDKTEVFLRCLTPLEQVVLSVIGDGSDDNTAAEILGMRAATIGTVRRDLHRKLGVQHRGELVRLAAQFGFVRFTASGILRPGFEALLLSYRLSRPKRWGSHPPFDAEPGDC